MIRAPRPGRRGPVAQEGRRRHLSPQPRSPIPQRAARMREGGNCGGRAGGADPGRRSRHPARGRGSCSSDVWRSRAGRRRRRPTGRRADLATSHAKTGSSEKGDDIGQRAEGGSPSAPGCKPRRCDPAGHHQRRPKTEGERGAGTPPPEPPSTPPTGRGRPLGERLVAALPGPVPVPVEVVVGAAH